MTISVPKPLKPEPKKAKGIDRRPKCLCLHAAKMHPGSGECLDKLGTVRECTCGRYTPSRSAPVRKDAPKSYHCRPCGIDMTRAEARHHVCGKDVKPKRKPIRKKSLRPLPKVRTWVWDLFAAYVKERDGDTCFSCGKAGLVGQNWHAGHMFPSGNNSILRYEPKNVHSQCGRCNCWLGGNGAAYVARFLEVYGLAELQRIDGRRGQEKTWTRVELEEMGAALKRGGADFECWYAERYAL